MSEFGPFKNLHFEDEFVDLKITEINTEELRNAEDVVSDYIDPSLRPDLALIVDTLLDDYNTTSEKPHLKKLFYIDCIKTKPGAEKGYGSFFLNRVINRLLTNKNFMFTLYASPFQLHGNKHYTEAEKAIYVPKLINIYKKLGFVSTEENSQIMYKYKVKGK